MTRAELIRELSDFIKCDCSPDCKLLDDSRDYIKELADFILSRERLLLEKIGNTLDYSGDVETGWIMAKEIIESNLAIIEKEGGE